MLFIEWWLLGRFLLCLLILLAAFLLFRIPRNRGPRRWFRALAWPIAIFGALALLNTSLIAGCMSYLPPVPSPRGRFIARIRAADEGILGETSSVEIFTAHGLLSALAFNGPWDSVHPSDLHWTSENSLEIHHTGAAFYCASPLHVRVHCVLRTPPDE